MNLELPQTTQDFLKFFEGDPLEMLPNPLENELYEEGCSLKHKLESAGLGCAFTNNSGTLILVFIGFFLLKMFMIFLAHIARKDVKLGIAVIWLNNKLNMLLFINLVYAFELDFVLSSIIELSNKIDGFWANFIGKTLAVLSLTSFIIMLLFLIKKAWNLRYRPKENKYWAFLKDDVKKTANFMANFMEEFIAIRDICIPLIVVVFYEIPML